MAWGETPMCLFEQSQYSLSTGKRPAPTSLGEEWGQEHLCHQKVPASPLQGWVPKGTPTPPLLREWLPLPMQDSRAVHS